ncbi:MAG: hypothetical protein GY950_31525 [bacterium]|nr:hypothetical protein [bacterium]
MNRKIKDRKGFTLLESLVTMSLFFIVLGSVYVMVVHYGEVANKEHSRLRMQQESRFMMTQFVTELKNAGAILNTSLYNEAIRDSTEGTPHFIGLYPLNHTDYPDGFIVASGDPEGATELELDPTVFTDGTFEIQDDGLSLPVKTTLPSVLNPQSELYDPVLAAQDPATLAYRYRQWRAGDKGILIGPQGYYVFSVAEVTETTLRMRSQAVYYSGLLNTQTGPDMNLKTYADPESPRGNEVSYPNGAPVYRLSSFGIYLVHEAAPTQYTIFERMQRQLIRVSDSMGDPDVLDGTSTSVKTIISENIWDIQIAYVAFDESFINANPDTPKDPNHHYFGPAGTATSADNLLLDMRQRYLKQLDISIVSLSDELRMYNRKTEMASLEANPLSVPAIGDQAGYDLPPGKYDFKLFTLIVELRNFKLIFDNQ